MKEKTYLVELTYWRFFEIKATSKEEAKRLAYDKLQGLVLENNTIPVYINDFHITVEGD